MRSSFSAMPTLWAMADAVGLEQAVGHLIQNAIDASAPSAPITVRVDGERR